MTAAELPAPVSRRARPPAGLDLNESCYPPLPAVAAVLRDECAIAHRYPEFFPDSTRRQVAGHLAVRPEQVVIGAGATGVVGMCFALARAAIDQPGPQPVSVVSASPTFDGYPIVAEMSGLRFVGVALRRGAVDLESMAHAVGPDTGVVVVCSPHNPTGSVLDVSAITEFVAALPPHVIAILDEAYIEFSEHPTDPAYLVGRHPNLVVIRTFSKAYGLAGLRVGYGVAQADLARRLRAFEVPFGICAPAIAAVPVALAAQRELMQRVWAMRTERQILARRLRRYGARPLHSDANFLFVPGREGVALGSLLITSGIPVKVCGAHGVRITVGSRADTDRIVAALRGLTDAV
ncbi:pyridoxal phosphate-dependent aminotransferase [Gordonia sp. NPDC003504]